MKVEHGRTLPDCFRICDEELKVLFERHLALLDRGAAAMSGYSPESLRELKETAYTMKKVLEDRGILPGPASYRC